MRKPRERIRGICRRGFTLVEILVVVVLLGILAAVVIPQFVDSSEDAAKVAFMTSGRSISQAAQRFYLETGEYPEDAGSGTLPAGFGNYVLASVWANGTPIGGMWDSERNSFGITSAVGVHFNGFGDSRGDDFMEEIDAALDDGVLNTGNFRKLAARRYYFIIAD